MATSTDIAPVLEKLDLQFLKLLQERAQVTKDLSESGGNSVREAELESLGLWIEEAADRGLDEVVVERIAKLVMLASRPTEE